MSAADENRKKELIDPNLSYPDANEPIETRAIHFLNALKGPKELRNLQQYRMPSFHLDYLLRCLQIDQAQPGHLKFLFTVKPAFTNRYRTLHGGAAATIACLVSEFAVETLTKDRTYSISELSVSYLAASRIQEQLKIEAKVLKFGKNIATVSVMISSKDTEYVIYQARATFYSMPTSSL